MQRYKVRVCNGDYSLSAVYDTIAEVYKCLCAVMSWALGHAFFQEDDLMKALVHLCNDEASSVAIKCAGRLIVVFKEANQDSNLD